jgi:hypothetical protein
VNASPGDLLDASPLEELNASDSRAEESHDERTPIEAWGIAILLVVAALNGLWVLIALAMSD